VFIGLQYSTETLVAAGREKGGVRARRNDEIHVTDFGGFDGVFGLGRTAEAGLLRLCLSDRSVSSEKR
jgi:hypothetical protein